ncbi:MAG: NADH-quinone oxidoreductase subunit NuoG [Fluviicoccus sp.]|uniref:NADH-quinone oxidoreductase subunit NuoG n=1 Tax=Fluviicoccus sp. TaxID=2003552 RepID=UPI0027258C3A|nr:NADH-quinone oxidoreductase subunit NuoG [Fluviicoccus sp.]MDO8330157.1 NADH-quinone oxidoreductase subunit NuoG [Fluviicoccus sp.]
MATIYVDGKPHEVNGADNLLQACLSLGLDIPYFCWHPALGSVGACRQCAVKQYANPEDKRGRIVMSCMSPSTDNTYISIDDEEAKAFRATIVELLMTNHPHDCPVCEEGGHCHLQDMTVMTGHDRRSYRFTKRTHQNQDLGPFISHEMNRCIACYRCVRYYKDYAGGEDLGVYGAHDNVYFGRPTDGTLESEFSGNLTEVCPTGVFTDKTHSARYNRKWDMQFAPSICQQCSVGCNTSPGERYGELRRIENRFNGSVNHYFLCDRGRFGYGYVNNSDRPRQPMMREGVDLVVVSVDEALDSAIAALRGKKVIGIGSPRASLETNFALRSLVGEANFSTGIATVELGCINLAQQVLLTEGIEVPSLRDIEGKDGVLVLGEDVTQTAPRIALALRQSVKNKAVKMAADRKTAVWQDLAVKNIAQHELSPLFITSFSGTRLDDVATGVCMAAVDDQARLGFAVAHCIDNNAPAVEGLDAEAQAFARQVAAALLAADKPLVVAGTAAGSEALIQAAANIVQALLVKGKKAAITLALPEVNSLGVSLMGGSSLESALEALRSGQAEIVVIAENDLYRRAPAALVDAALAKAAKVIVLDHQQTATTAKAHILMSAASFAEGDGTAVNNEGRAQRYFQVYDSSYYKPEHQIKEGWRWLHAIHSGLDYRDIDWTHLDDVVSSCAEAIPVLAGMVQAAPNAAFRISGVRPAREPRRYSGRTAMRAKLSVHEPRQPQDGDSALSFSMEGYVGPKNDTALTSFAWAPGWNSPQAWNKFQAEVGGHLSGGDPGVRLLDSAPHHAGGYFKNIPSAFTPRAEALKVHLLHHIFGSDELAARAAVMSSRIPDACITLAAEDAASLRLADGQTAVVSIGMKLVKIPARIDPDQPSGTVGVIAGIPGLPALNGDEWLQVSGEGA